MQFEKSNSNGNIHRMLHSYASDMIYRVTRGRVITEKHVLVELGLHNLTGQHNDVQIANHLGYFISYNTVCEIETDFGVDNIDVKVERLSGAGSVHTTHLVAFQETSDTSIEITNLLNLPRTRSRKMQFNRLPNSNVTIDPKAEPINIHTFEKILQNNSKDSLFSKYFTCGYDKENQTHLIR